MTDVAETLSHQIGPLRRTLLRSTRAAGDLPDLPDAQIEVLRALASHGPITPGALADELGLARSTISNLLKAMSAGGLITRTLIESDGRSTALTASDHAIALLARYDRASTELIERALGKLDPRSRRNLESAMPALVELREALESL